MSTADRKTLVLLSMQIRCWDELVRYGVHDIMKREYGSLVRAEPESEYNVTLEVDLEQLPPEGGECIRSPAKSPEMLYLHQSPAMRSSNPSPS